MMEVVVTTGACKSSPPANQQPVFTQPDALPVAQKSNSVRALKVMSIIHRCQKLSLSLPTHCGTKLKSVSARALPALE